MIESRQKMIDMTDCDETVFQGFPCSLSFNSLILSIEFLRFIYCDELQLDANLAIKLLVFSDKYLQDDLNEKCLSYLTHNITSENVYTILDFARQENISHVKSWCMKFFNKNINVHNISGLVEFLNKQNNPEFALDNLELRDKALGFITKNFIEISKGQNKNTKMTFYEDFLIKNIDTDTIVILANFLSTNSSEKPASNGYQESEIQMFGQETRKLRSAVFGFAQQNMKILRANKIAKNFSKTFLIDLVVYESEKNQRLKSFLYDTSLI